MISSINYYSIELCHIEKLVSLRKDVRKNEKEGSVLMYPKQKTTIILNIGLKETKFAITHNFAMLHN